MQDSSVHRPSPWYIPHFMVSCATGLKLASSAVNSPEVCCFEFFDKRIPKANIVSINKTHSQCSTPAFV
uniref:Chemokine interleukin-8-like domain-containing protein n=1 Tax=Maylandia zebra TaxID=106582 RepID=A0A3P9CFP8_9CICH